MSTRPFPTIRAGSQEAVFRFSLHGTRFSGRSRASIRRARSCSSASFPTPVVKRRFKFPVHRSVDAREAPPGLRGQITSMRASAPGRLPGGAADAARSGRRLDRRRGRSRRWIAHMQHFDRDATLDLIAARSGVTMRSSTAERSNFAASGARALRVRRGSAHALNLCRRTRPPFAAPIFSTRGESLERSFINSPRTLHFPVVQQSC